MIDAEGNGTANVFFINDNSRTKWDLTGVSNDINEIVGDFYISENTQSLEQRMIGGQGMQMPGGGMPGGGMPGGGMPGGGMPGGMDSGVKGNFINATFQNSEWTGTVPGGGAFKAGKNVTIETRKEDAEEDAE